MDAQFSKFICYRRKILLSVSVKALNLGWHYTELQTAPTFFKKIFNYYEEVFSLRLKTLRE